jgi:hypothetical protein
MVTCMQVAVKQSHALHTMLPLQLQLLLLSLSQHSASVKWAGMQQACMLAGPKRALINCMCRKGCSGPLQA